MKFEKRTIVIIIVAVLSLTWYLFYNFDIIEGAQNASSVETKLKTISDALNNDKFKNPTNDPVTLSEKLNLFIQRRDLLTEFLKAPQFVKPKGKKITDMKAAYEKLLKETTDAIPALTTERNNAQSALDASRKKKNDAKPPQQRTRPTKDKKQKV